MKAEKMTKIAKDPNLNPHFAEVIGFVDAKGQLQEIVSEFQYNLLINVGSEDGVAVGERVIVFKLGPQISDPKTGRDLGCFEIVRGEGRIKTTQTRMSVISCTDTTTETRRRSNTLASIALASGSQLETEKVTVTRPFRNPELGDRVRFV